MSQFSTGELAKVAEVSVRTVQYYDQRGILTPSEVTEGGRRIYHDSDLERLQVICFLRDLDFSINQIKKLLQEENREGFRAFVDRSNRELGKVFEGNRGQTKTCPSLAKSNC